jgi:hypothetical protein
MVSAPLDDPAIIDDSPPRMGRRPDPPRRSPVVGRAPRPAGGRLEDGDKIFDNGEGTIEDDGNGGIRLENDPDVGIGPPKVVETIVVHEQRFPTGTASRPGAG